MSELEGFKINMDSIASNAMNTVNSSMQKNKKQGVIGISGVETSGSTEAVQNPVSGVASGLLGVATDMASALSKAALGETAGEKLSNFANEISENLTGNLDTFQSNIESINNSVASCNSTSAQANGILSNSIETVDNNGNLVGLNLNIAQAQGDTSTAKVSTPFGLSSKNNAFGKNGQDILNNEAQTIGINIVNNEVNNDKKVQDSKNSGEQKQVFSCDWGNGAKSADEIENQNNQIKTFGNNKNILAAAGNILNKKSSVKKAGNSDSKIQSELDSIRKQENEEIKKLSKNEENDKDIKDLQQRVENDSQGVQATDSVNTAGVSKEQGYKNQITSNNTTGNSYFGEAKDLTAQAKEFAESGRANFLDAAQKNREAADLFKDPLKEAEALKLAKEAMQGNASGNSDSEQSSSEENKSRQKQKSAFSLASESMNSIIPQFENSTQQRIATNQQSLDIQNKTKDAIENKQNSSDNNVFLAGLENLKSKEDDLLSKYNSQKDLFSGIFDYGEANEEGTDKKLSNLIA